MKQIIGITMGDPKGVGPEVIAKAWKEMGGQERDHFRIYGDRNALDSAAELTGGAFDLKHVVTTSSTSEEMGRLSEGEAARMALSAIDAAVEDVSAGHISAIVTAPVNKHRLQAIVPGFLGHTEYLAKKAGVREVVMMFFTETMPEICRRTNMTSRFCVSLVTMHLPIKDVAEHITKDRVLTTIKRTHEALERHFACPDARIAVMALNPHAGEVGSIGREEERVIEPAIKAAQREGVNCVGPLPADSMFKKLSEFDYDAIVAMYHDQGLIPVKLLCQGQCINMTLGLPYVRTSPSHGTAEDIAWLGQASHENMLTAIRRTRELVGWRINGN
ncbi:MAG: 4-hydroxythreonine-4-phosphate dehydrogenase PdxA [Proteobacteria bacterium]|nr:4-hydroxythreonine-4-phosphate dehydrogenase PdxA [Pseudomonadota bacterium]